MDDKIILLVEDNADDEALTLRALKKNNIKNDVVVAHDGVEALDYLLSAGGSAGRPPHAMPQLVLLDLKLPRVAGGVLPPDGLGVSFVAPGCPRPRPVPSRRSASPRPSSRRCFRRSATSSSCSTSRGAT